MTTPEDQLFNLLSVRRLITAPDEADHRCVVCELQELNRLLTGPLWRSHLGEHTSTRGAGAYSPCAGWEFSQPQLLRPVCWEVGDPVTGGGWHWELGELKLRYLRYDGVER